MTIQLQPLQHDVHRNWQKWQYQRKVFQASRNWSWSFCVRTRRVRPYEIPHPEVFHMAQEQEWPIPRLQNCKLAKDAPIHQTQMKTFIRCSSVTFGGKPYFWYNPNTCTTVVWNRIKKAWQIRPDTSNQLFLTAEAAMKATCNRKWDFELISAYDQSKIKWKKQSSDAQSVMPRNRYNEIKRIVCEKYIQRKLTDTTRTYSVHQLRSSKRQRVGTTSWRIYNQL